MNFRFERKEFGKDSSGSCSILGYSGKIVGESLCDFPKGTATEGTTQIKFDYC